MKKFHIYEPVLGTWYEQNGRKRMDGVVDLAPIIHHGSKKVPVIFVAPNAEQALRDAQGLGFKDPIIGEVNEIH